MLGASHTKCDVGDMPNKNSWSNLHLVQHQPPYIFNRNYSGLLLIDSFLRLGFRAIAKAGLNIPKRKISMFQKISLCAILVFTSLAMVHCSTVPETAADREALTASVNAAVAKSKAKDPSLEKFLKTITATQFFPRLETAAPDLLSVTAAGRYFKAARQLVIAT